MNFPSNIFLQAIKDFWHAHPSTCIKVSSADLLQFAIFFATVRQSGAPGLDPTKRDRLISEFQWGREDETNCDPNWTDNLPGFTTAASGGPIPPRCAAAGEEIEEKMMNRNGFTAGMSEGSLCTLHLWYIVMEFFFHH